MRFPFSVMNTADAAVSDAPVAEAPAAIVAEAVIENAQEPVEVVEPEAKPEPPAKKPWFLDRIAEESAKARAAQDKLDAAERRAKAAEELAERLQAGKEATYKPQAPDNRSYTQADIRAEAERLKFHEDTVEVRNAGMAKYGAAFLDTLSTLGAVGATNNDEFVQDVLAVNKADAHVLLDLIAKDPEKAVALASMTSRQRIAELTRMTVQNTTTETKAAPAPKTVSKAPAPAPKVEPSASKVSDWRTDEATDADFDRGFEEMMKRRSNRR